MPVIDRKLEALYVLDDNDDAYPGFGREDAISVYEATLRSGDPA